MLSNKPVEDPTRRRVEVSTSVINVRATSRIQDQSPMNYGSPARITENLASAMEYHENIWTSALARMDICRSKVIGNIPAFSRLSFVGNALSQRAWG